MQITDYLHSASEVIPGLQNYAAPWDMVGNIEKIVAQLVEQIEGEDFKIDHAQSIAIHRTARIDPRAVIHGPAVIGENCLVGPNSFLRGGVFLGPRSIVGFCCEVKSSFIFADSAVTHLNYVADSIIGNNVNIEAGVVFLNYFNEKSDKEIRVKADGKIIQTGITKFGALVGDNCRLGGNAALTPGTILKPNTIVKRLELIQQIG